MNYLPPSIGAVVLYFIIRFLIKTNKEMTKSSEHEGAIKGDNFTMRDETLEEQNDPMRKLIEEAKITEEKINKI